MAKKKGFGRKKPKMTKLERSNRAHERLARAAIHRNHNTPGYSWREELLSHYHFDVVEKQEKENCILAKAERRKIFKGLDEDFANNNMEYAMARYSDTGKKVEKWKTRY